MSGQTPPIGLKHSGLRVLAITVVPVIILLALVMPLTRPGQHPLHLKTCLAIADSLRVGAGVRISGVVVGTVRKMQVRPDDHACPVAVEMELRTGYALRIPRDSKTYSATAGVLGDPYVGIDSSEANGPPIEEWGTLPSKVVPQFGGGQFHKDPHPSLNHIDESLQKSGKKDEGASAVPTAP